MDQPGEKKLSGDADLSDRLFKELTKKFSGRNRFYQQELATYQ